MTNEEKILDILASMSLRMDSMEQSMTARMDSMEQSMTARMDSMEQSMTARMDSMEQSMTARMDSMEQSMTARMDSLENAVLKINIRLETEVIPKQEALAEGLEAVLEQLVPVSRVDELERRVKFLESMLLSMSEEVHKLKQAQ